MCLRCWGRAARQTPCSVGNRFCLLPRSSPSPSQINKQNLKNRMYLRGHGSQTRTRSNLTPNHYSRGRTHRCYRSSFLQRVSERVSASAKSHTPGARHFPFGLSPASPDGTYRFPCQSSLVPREDKESLINDNLGVLGWLRGLSV